VPPGEVLQDSRTIVADGGQLQSLRLKSLLCALQLHELRFAEGSPIGGAKKKKEDSALRPFHGLVGLCMAELIGKIERRRRLTDLQATRRRNRAIGRRAFLPAGKTEESGKRRGWPPQSSFWLQIRFRYLLVARRHSDAKHKRSKMLIRKSSKPGSPHPSRIRSLDNHRDPNIPGIFGAEIKFHVSAKPCGLI